MRTLEHVKKSLGEHFCSLALEPSDEVDVFINERLDLLGMQRGYCGWYGIQAVAKLRAMLKQTRDELREAAIEAMKLEASKAEPDSAES